MKIGDIGYCAMGFKWIIFEEDGGYQFLYIARFEDHSNTAYLSAKDIIAFEKKPENVEWLFLKRRAKNLKGMEFYL